MPLRFHPATRAILLWGVYPATVVIAGVYGGWVWTVVAMLAVLPGYQLLSARPRPTSI